MQDPTRIDKNVEELLGSQSPTRGFYTNYDKLQSEYTQKFNKPWTTTGSDTWQHRKFDPLGARDTRSKDKSQDEINWIVSRAQELGIHVRDFSKRIPKTGTGYHIHMQPGSEVDARVAEILGKPTTAPQIPNRGYQIAQDEDTTTQVRIDRSATGRLSLKPVPRASVHWSQGQLEDIDPEDMSHVYNPDSPYWKSPEGRTVAAVGDVVHGLASFGYNLGDIAVEGLLSTIVPTALTGHQDTHGERASQKAKTLLLDPQIAEYKKAQQLARGKGYKDGRAALADPEIAAHFTAAFLPLVGPAAAHAGERMGSGDVEGGLVESVAVVAPIAFKGLRPTKGLPELPQLGETLKNEAPAANGISARSAPGEGITTLNRDNLKVEVNKARVEELKKEGETPKQINARVAEGARHENYHALIEKQDPVTMQAVGTWASKRLSGPSARKIQRAVAEGKHPFEGAGGEALEHRFIEETYGNKSVESELPPVPRSGTMTPQGAGISNEELSRTGTFYKVGKNGQLTYMGKQADATLRPGEATAYVKADGSIQTYAGDSGTVAKFESKLRKAMEKPPTSPPTFEMSDAERRQTAAAVDKFKAEEPSGAGAMRTGYKPPQSELAQLGESIESAVETAKQAGEQPSQLDPLPKSPLGIQARLQSATASAKAKLSDVWQNYKAGPARPITDVESASMDLQAQHQKITLEGRQFAKTVTDAVPEAARRDAIFRYAAANGDLATLQDWANRSTNPKAKLGYENALKLTDTERIIAENFKGFFEPMLQQGLDAGIITSAIDDYVTQIVKKGPKGSKLAAMQGKIAADAQASLLNPNFKFGRERVFPSVFEGEQAGYTYDTDFASAANTYYSAMGKAIASRNYLKSLQDTLATDGRPAVAVSGSGRALGDTTFVRPDAKYRRGVDISDYGHVDNWAFKGWKWVQNIEGNDVMLQGDLLVNPEFLKKTKNRFESSAIRDYAVGRAALKTQGFVKGTMFSLSPFHIVQEAVHGLGHTVNPFSNLPKLDPASPPVMEAMRGGLQLAGGSGAEMFAEGLSGRGSLINMVPGIGKLNAAMTDWTFHDFIPRLKLKTYNHILERNTARYANQLTREQIVSMSADQANAAYGELNYFKLGRSKTMQDLSRLVALAPDFLEARARFVGQALKPYGREQARALMVLAVGQYVAARIANQLGHGDAEWSPERMFQVKAGDKWWGIRSVPGDMLHLASDWRGFINWRLNPTLVIPPLEALSGTEFRSPGKDIGKDWVIKKGKTLPEVGLTTLERSTPMPLQGLTRDQVDLLDSILQSVGVVQMRTDKKADGKGMKKVPGMGGMKKMK